MGKAATFQQSAYPTDNGTAYPTNIDTDIQVVANLAAQFAPHQVPPSPGVPQLSQVAGGTIGATTYYVKTTFVTPSGETIPSSEANLAVLPNDVLVVSPPAQSGSAQGCTGWNVYVSTSTGTETKQNGSTPIALGTSWQEPATGLVAGAALPAGLSQMTILVDPGSLFVSGAIVSQAQQQSAVITAPVANPRIDRVVIDGLTGAISVITGVENASPSAPAITQGKLPCCQILLSVGETAIGNSTITDERMMGAVAAKSPTRTVLALGSGTYTTPTGATRINVRMVGGGGGGAGGGPGGTSASNGGNTTFGTLTCNGGGGGGPGAVQNPGAGGTATGGNINLTGADGGGGSSVANTSGAPGGSSPFGGAGGMSVATAAGDSAKANTGSGGGGGGNAGGASGGGGGAGGYLEKLIVGPNATYAYAIGAGGTHGNAGQANGGDGASGIIIVDEYYD